MNIKIKKIHENVVIPEKATKGAVCMDVIATEVIQNSPNHVTIKLGFSTEIPIGYKGCIVPRSSFTQKGWIMQNSPAQIDSDYRGEWMIKFEGIPFPPMYTDKRFQCAPFPYKAGDRCAQIYFEKVEDFIFEEIQELSETLRGEGGFGSTGVK